MSNNTSLLQLVLDLFLKQANDLGVKLIVAANQVPTTKVTIMCRLDRDGSIINIARIGESKEDETASILVYGVDDFYVDIYYELDFNNPEQRIYTVQYRKGFSLGATQIVLGEDELVKCEGIKLALKLAFDRIKAMAEPVEKPKKHNWLGDLGTAIDLYFLSGGPGQHDP